MARDLWSFSHLKDGIEAKTVLYTKCDVTSEAEIEAAFDFANKNLALPDKLGEVEFKNEIKILKK